MIKGRLSVVIPNYNSPFASKTIQDILDKAKGDIEVIVNVEMNWPEPLSTDPRVHYIHGSAPIGMRAGINKAVAMSTGEFIMKCDDHVMFGEGFDEILKADHQPNWIQVPRRYALDAENWKIGNEGDSKYPIDAMYTDFPLKGKANDDGTHGVHWREYRDANKDIELLETPSIQGSCWFLTRDYFDNFLGGLHEEGYGQFAQESQELCFKAWLGGGKVITNKKTYYCHLHKGKTYGRMYRMPGGVVEADNWAIEHWANNKEPKMIHPFSWFINEKFPNMPGWPSNWEQILKDQGTIHE